MAGAVTSPVAYDLTVAGLPAKVYSTGVTADADGFYYKAGQLVEIAADETIKVAATAGAAIGVLEDSITVKTNPNGLDARTRVTVLPFGYRRVLRMTAEGDLTAGTRVCQGTTSKQAVKAMADLAATLTVDASELAAATTVDATGLTAATTVDATGLTAATTVDATGLTAATTVDATALAGSIPVDSTPVQSDAAQPTVAITGDVTAATTLSGDVTAATTLSGDVTAATALSGDVTATAALAGGILPEKEIGIVWKGAANGKVALILAY